MLDDLLNTLESWWRISQYYLLMTYDELSTNPTIIFLIELLAQVPWFMWVSLLMIPLIRRLLRKKAKSRHEKNIKAGDKALSVLRGISASEKSFSYLRKTDPYIFEEMVLSALKRTGYKITRNNAYSGDGGIDGRALIKGKETLIQAKRYAGHISNKHVLEFMEICKRQKCKGIFIHTGKTGKLSAEHAGDELDIVSGERMLNLMKSKAFQPIW